MKRRNFIKLITGLFGVAVASRVIANDKPAVTSNKLPVETLLQNPTQLPIGGQILWKGEGEGMPRGYVDTGRVYYQAKIIQRIF